MHGNLDKNGFRTSTDLACMNIILYKLSAKPQLGVKQANKNINTAHRKHPLIKARRASGG